MPISRGVRDAYGFEVKREYLELYQKYAPLWEKEETERAERWASFLSHFDTDEVTGQTSSERQAAQLEVLERELSSWRHADRGRGSLEAPPWQQQLRSMVQAGVPMAFRGRMWKILLDLSSKRKAGVYDRLVVKALGKKHRIRRKTDDAETHTPAQPSIAATAASSQATPLEPSLSLQPGEPQGPPTLSTHPTTPAPAAPTDSTSDTSAAAWHASFPDAGAAEPSDPASANAETAPGPGGEGGGSPTGALATGGGRGPDPVAGGAGPGAAEAGRGPDPASAGRDSAAGGRSGVAASGGTAAGAPARTKPGWHPSCRDWNLQIEKDLHRTFPGHPVMDSSGRSALRRILAAYAHRNPSVGYCQGMNFIAGCLLLFMDEEDAFWALASVVEDLLPGYFSLAMVAPQVDQLVFKAMVDTQFTTLASHLEEHGVSVTSVSTQWFLCIFVNSLPLETCLRVWDVFFFECCSSVLFRVALALVDIYNQALLSTVDSVDAFSLLQHMAPMSYDSSRLVDVACIGFAHITYKHLNALRAVYFAQVAQLVQEAAAHDEDDAHRRYTSDEVEFMVTRSAASSPNFFADGLPPDPEVEPLASPTSLPEADGFQLVPSTAHPGLPPSFGVNAGIVELSDGSSPPSSPGGPSQEGGHSPGESPVVAEEDSWHDTPVWPDITTFSQHTLRHLSKLSNVTLSETAVSSLGSPAAGADLRAEEGATMEESMYREAAARTARLAAGLPSIQVSSAPAAAAQPRGPTAAISEYLWSLLLTGSSGDAAEPPGVQPTIDGRPDGSPSVLLEHASRSEAAETAFQIAATPARYSGTGSEGDGGASGGTDSVREANVEERLESSSGTCRTEEARVQVSEAASRSGDAEAAAPANTAGQQDSEALSDMEEASSLLHKEGGEMVRDMGRASSPPNKGAGEMARDDARASPNVPQHREAGEMVRDEGIRRTTLEQLLTVVEGLENELFLAEARRHEAEVAADALEATAEGLRGKLQAAQDALTARWEQRQQLEAGVARAGRDASAAEKAAAIQAAAVSTARSQLALRDSLLAEKDALIEGLQRQAGLVPENAGMRFLRGLTRFRRPTEKQPDPASGTAPEPA